MSGIHHNKGFTLVEVQIALMILLLLFAVMMGGLHLSGKTWKTAETVSEQSADLRVVSNLLRRQMSGVIPLTWISGQGSLLVFSGKSDELTYVGHLPVHAVGGGPWLIRIHTNNEQELRLDYRMLDTARSPLEFTNEKWNSIRLLDDVEKITVSYQQPPDEQNQSVWRDYWDDDNDSLPLSINITLQVNKKNWPELVLPLPAYEAKGLLQYVMRSDHNLASAEVELEN